MKIKTLSLKKPINFLGFKTIISDIKELPLAYKWLLVILGFFVVFLSFFDFNYFIGVVKSPYSIINTLNAPKPYLGNMPKWLDATLYSLSGVVSFTGVLNVFLISYGKMSNYFWGVINSTTFALFALDFGYSGDAQLNLFFYLPFQFVGWYMWQKSMDQPIHEESKNEIDVRNSKWYLVFLVAIPLVAIISVGWFYEIPWFNKVLTGGAEYKFQNVLLPHIFDSLSNAISIVGSLLMFLRLKEQWILWIIRDVMVFIMFCGIGGNVEINLLIQMSLFTTNAIVGLLKWWGFLNNPKQKAKSKPIVKKTTEFNKSI